MDTSERRKLKSDAPLFTTFLSFMLPRSLISRARQWISSTSPDYEPLEDPFEMSIVEPDDTPSLGPFQTLFRLSWVIGIGWTVGLYFTYPTPTTVPVFIGAAIIMGAWTILAWIQLALALARKQTSCREIVSSFGEIHCSMLAACTGLLLWWASLTLISINQLELETVDRRGEKYFIAINLHDNEAIVSTFVVELIALIYHRKWTGNRSDYSRQKPSLCVDLRIKLPRWNRGASASSEWYVCRSGHTE